MAALKSDLSQFNTPQYAEGHSGDSDEFYDMKYDDDDDVDICDVAPTSTIGNDATPGTYAYAKQTPPGFTEVAPGSHHGETHLGTETGTHPQAMQRNASLDTVHLAISSLQKEIYNSENERKATEMAIERQFTDIINHIIDKKFQIIHKMNTFYDEQKQQSMNRISELKQQLDEKELEIQRQREKEMEKQQQFKREEEQKAIRDNALNDPSLKLNKRLSIIGNKLLYNASKAKDKASAYIEEWKRQHNGKQVAPAVEYSKHDKMRLFMPQKELLKIITNNIKLSTEWWNVVQLNHIIFNTHDAELWRTSDTEIGWYNAFGSIKIGKSQGKRWNIKICERIKQYEPVSGKKQPADVMVGVIESNRRKSQTKPCGFWQKSFAGFGFYGLDGKIVHKKTKGKAYSNPFYAGSVIGIEVNMHITPGMELKGKPKPKMNMKSKKESNKKNIGIHGGVIKFYVDDHDCGVAFYDLDLNKEYSLAVSLNSNVYSLQLMD
eukprot:9790_1